MAESESSPLIHTAAALTAPLAEADAEPAGGALAALTAALAASLVAAAANHSRSQWPEAGGVRAQAQALRRRLLALAESDIEVYADARQALAGRGAGAGEGAPDAGEGAPDADLGQTVSLAAEVPLRIAGAAGDVAELAAAVADHGDPEFRADAAIAAILAAAAARAAAHLVEINLVVGTDGGLVGEAAERARAAEDAAAGAQQT